MITAFILLLIVGLVAIFFAVWLLSGDKQNAKKAAEKTTDSQINR